MIALSIYPSLQKKYLFPCILIACYAVVFALALRNYMNWQSAGFFLGVASLPLVTSIDPSRKGGRRFGIAAGLLILLMLLTPLKTVLYFSLVFALLFVIESFAGKVSMLPLMACILMSPFFDFIAGVFGFPIRIQLTEWAGNIMRLFEDKVEVIGNILALNGVEFSVDPACMGLNMMVVSLLTGIILAGIYQKKFSRTISFLQVNLLMIFILVLNMVSNLIRIILLVQFRIMPENPMHEIAGLLCLLIYVLIPAIFLTKWMVKKYGSEFAIRQQAKYVTPSYLFHLILLAGLLVTGYRIITRDATVQSINIAATHLQGYTLAWAANDVIKAESKQALIYIKPIPNFYNADHNPMICWQGSGYEFKKVKNAVFKKLAVYTGTLQKGHDILYTAWWYDNGDYQTSAQMDWRWKMACGSKAFALVNVTSSSPGVLQTEVESFLKNRLSRKILHQ